MQRKIPKERRFQAFFWGGGRKKVLLAIDVSASGSVITPKLSGVKLEG
jgi:hypothetical protein